MSNVFGLRDALIVVGVAQLVGSVGILSLRSVRDLCDESISTGTPILTST
jgi:hypothetical protein